MGHRLENLREKLDEKGLDAILISTPENRRYISGFTGSAGYLVVSREEAILATDFRYTEQAGGQAPGFESVKAGRDWSWFLDLLKERSFKKVGFESQQMTVASYSQLTSVLKDLSNRPSLVAVSGMVESLRTIKDQEEIALLQKAVDIADAAMEAVSRAIEPGETEREVAWRMEKAMRELGADSLSFGTIVAAGPNGAMPHHRPTDRPIRAGEPIVIDMGARVGGYCSDLTRTVCIGEPDAMFRKIYDIVLGAQLTAIENVGVGMTGHDADGLARTVISEAGYGETFGHSLGHGVGLFIHEGPVLGPNSQNVLEEGMVFAVEPGIYISGWGGVRTEDVVQLGKDGAKVLGKAAK